jgi:hypothetical protein
MEHIKMSEKNEYLKHIGEFSGKYGAWILYVLIGMIGKVGLDILNERKINGWYFLGSSFAAVFVGFISAMWFMKNQPEAGAYIVPVLTLCSRDVLIFLSLIDWRKKLSNIFKVETKKED